MNCMKCGREIQDGQVFCPGCLEVMEKFPIAPGVHIQIPRRPARAPEKKAKEIPPQVQIASLKKLIRWLWITVALLIAACGVLALLLFQDSGAVPQVTPTGRNYTTAPHVSR